MKFRNLVFVFLFVCVCNIQECCFVYAQDLSQREYINIAKNLESVGDFKSAEQKYLEGIKKYNSAILWVELAKLYYKTGDYDSVLKITDGKIRKDFYNSVGEVAFIHNDSLYKTGSKYLQTIPFIAGNGPVSDNALLKNKEKQTYKHEVVQLYSELSNKLLKIRDNNGLAPHQIIYKIKDIISALSRLSEIMAECDVDIPVDMSNSLDNFSYVARLEDSRSEELIGEDYVKSGESSIRALSCNALIIKNLAEVYLDGNSIKYEVVNTPDGICLDDEYDQDQYSDNKASALVDKQRQMIPDKEVGKTTYGNKLPDKAQAYAIIRDNCNMKWIDNYEMIEDCVKNQISSFNRISNLSGEIFDSCYRKWINNYEMVEYCYKSQTEPRKRLYEKED